MTTHDALGNIVDRNFHEMLKQQMLKQQFEESIDHVLACFGILWLRQPCQGGVQ
jgi:hypothetical protein